MFTGPRKYHNFAYTNKLIELIYNIISYSQLEVRIRWMADILDGVVLIIL